MSVPTGPARAANPRLPCRPRPLALALAVALALSAPAVPAATITVNDDGGGSGGMSVCTLISDIQASADGAEIVFAPAAALMADDDNGLSDVYRYRASPGEISLLSRAR